jgi:predicted phosphodiesterase
MPKSPLRLAAEKLCAAFTGAATQVLARRLADEMSVTVENARTMVRKVRGNHGKLHRESATSPKPNGTSGAVRPSMPRSIAEPWLPFDLGSGIKVAVLSDIHIPYHSEIAFQAAVKYCKKRKPDVVLLNGDFVDFYTISRHQKDPSKRDFKGEVVLAQAGLSWIRSQFPKARIVLKAGNHEERWQHWLWDKAPEICNFDRMTLSEWLDCPEYGIEVVQDQRPIMAGRLPIMHGHETGKGISAPVNAARGLFLRTNSTMLVGHGHRTSQHVEPDWKHIETACWSTGCLCDMNPPYAVINKWNHGFAFIPVDASGGWHVDNLRLSPEGDAW